MFEWYRPDCHARPPNVLSVHAAAHRKETPLANGPPPPTSFLLLAVQTKTASPGPAHARVLNGKTMYVCEPPNPCPALNRKRIHPFLNKPLPNGCLGKEETKGNVRKRRKKKRKKVK